jgi:hypothetical protein
MGLTESRCPYGGFLTEIEKDGTAKSLHAPSGHCTEWADGGWSGDDLAKKLIATIPGITRIEASGIGDACRNSSERIHPTAVQYTQ